MATGKLTVRPYSIVRRILYDKDKKKATGVEVVDAETNLTYTFYAKVIFVNASALNSAWILMNSATDIWPDGLGSSSGCTLSCNHRNSSLSSAHSYQIQKRKEEQNEYEYG